MPALVPMTYGKLQKAITVLILACCVVLAVPEGAFADTTAEALANRVESTNPLQSPENLAGVTSALDMVGVSLDPKDFVGGPGPRDMSYQLLHYVLGEPVFLVRERWFRHSKPEPRGNATLVTRIGQIMIVVAMAFGAMLVTYIVGVGLIKTSQTGRFLGNWDTVFLPLRTGVGFVLNLPAPMYGGINLAQAITLYVALMGMGIGSVMFAYVIDSQGSVPITVTQSHAHYVNAANAMVSTKTCEVFLEHHQQVLTRVGPQRTTVNSATGEEVLHIGPDGICGSVRLQRPGAIRRSIDRVRGFFSSSEPADAPASITDQVTAAWLQLYESSEHLDRLARALVTGDGSSGAADLARLTADLSNIMLSTVASNSEQLLAGAHEETMRRLKECGWVCFGSFWWSLNATQNQIHAATIDSIPVLENVGLTRRGRLPAVLRVPAVRREWNSVYDRRDELFAAAEGTVRDALRMRNQQANRSRGAIIGTLLGISDGMTRKADGATTWVIQRASYSTTQGASYRAAQQGNYDPLLEMRTIGNTILSIGTAALLADFVGAMGGDDDEGRGGGSGERSAPGKAADYVGGLVATASMMLLAAGLILAYGLPALPYLQWTIAMIGYLTYVVQSFLVAPLWSVMHMTADGSDLTGRGGNGYPILANLLLRPVLMVGGMVLGIAIFRASAWLINETLLESVIATREGTVGLPLTPIVVLFLYALMQLINALMCFSLSYKLPEVAGRWLGVQDSLDLGEADGANRTYMFFGNLGGGLRSMRRVPGVGR